MVAVTHSLSWPAYFLLDVTAVMLLLLAALTLALVKLVKNTARRNMSDQTSTCFCYPYHGILNIKYQDIENRNIEIH